MSKKKNKEHWVPVYGYEGRYMISDQARIYSLRTRQIMKPYVNDNGYLVIRLTAKDGTTKIKRVHRLLMLSFVGPDPEKPVVNHKDGVKLNLDLDNLEWATSLENNIHAFNMGLRTNESRKVEYRVTIDNQTFEGKGAKSVAKQLHEAGYFQDQSTDALKSGIIRCALKHTLFCGILKCEKIDDPYDNVVPYNKCGIKGRLIYAELPSGLVIKGKGPSKLVDVMIKIGLCSENENRDKLIKAISGAAYGNYKFRNCRIWYA